MLRGSCLCGGVKYEIRGKVSDIGQCHCSRCRKTSGTAANAVLLTSTRSFRWVQGEDLVQSWNQPVGRGNTFCRSCGSPLPALHPNGKVWWVPAGGLDDDPGTRIAQHIFVGSKASWDEISSGAPQYEEAAPVQR